jgi:hypothetical protein
MGFGYDGLGASGDDDGASFVGGGMGAVEATMGEIGEGMLARVATNDPAPLGDLNVRSGPGTSYPRVGGVDKSGVVMVEEITTDAGGKSWAKIVWTGGRNVACRGWVAGWLLEDASDAPAVGPDPDAPPPLAMPGAGGGGGNAQQVSAQSGGMSSAAKLGIGAGLVGLGALAYYAFGKRAH